MAVPLSLGPVHHLRLTVTAPLQPIEPNPQPPSSIEGKAVIMPPDDRR